MRRQMGFVRFLDGLLLIAGGFSVVYGMIIQDIPVVMAGISFWFLAAVVTIVAVKHSWRARSNKQVKLLRAARGESYLDMLDMINEDEGE